MNWKTILLAFLLLLNSMVLVPPSVPADEVPWWDTSWSYRQEITLPIDTSTTHAKWQPVDLQIHFEHPCWAPTDEQHSIRVVMHDDQQIEELESQIYDLTYRDTTHILSCNLVFLIPETASGDEQYYVYYNEAVTPASDYPDHVGIEESYYYLEPIPGYPFESRYFKITQDQYIVYAVAQEGEFMSYHTSQHVTKLREETTEAVPKNGELFAAFDFRYYYGQDMYDYSSTSTTLLSKQILVDGNLMVQCHIISGSARNDLKTTATYTYYYCPTPHTRIHAHVKHEALSFDSDE